MSADRFDVVIVGGGPGGYIGAIRAAQLGFKTACIEKSDTLGGTCVNVGCIPSKALLYSTELFAMAEHKFSKHGIKLSGVELDLPTMMKRKESVVRQNTNGVSFLFKKNKIEWIKGEASFSGPKELKVKGADGERTVTADHIVIATGSEPVQLPPLPFDGKHVISSTEALALEKVPEHLVVVGGGVIGLELGSVWKRLGAKVTVIEFMPDILATMDKDVGKEMKKILSKQGFDFKLGAKVTGSKVKGKKVTVEFEDKDGNKDSVECDVVLAAVGRRPYTAGLGLDKVGVETDKAGRIKIDNRFRTNVEGVYAIGDVVEGPMLAHKAEEEGVVLAELLAGQAGHVNHETIPGIVYTWPEVGAVGISEQQAKERGLNVKIGKVPFMANGRARASDDVDGFVKVIADAKTDRVLGVHIVGPQASELISECVTVMEFAGSSEDIGRIVHGHPTLSETVKEAALAVDKRTLNF